MISQRSTAGPWVTMALAFVAVGSTLAAEPSDLLEKARPYTLDAWRVEQGLPHNTVYSVMEARDGYLWVGTGDGAARFDGSRFVVFDALTTDGLIDKGVLALFEGRDGTVWLGTEGRGLIAWREGKLERDERIGHDEVVLSIAATHDGGVWVGTKGNGLWRLPPQGQARVLGAADGLPGDFVPAVLEDSARRLWVGTYDGLARVDPEAMRVVQTFDSVAGKRVTSVLEDSAGTIRVGTQSGVMRVADETLVRTETTKRIVYDLTEDSEGTVWVAGVGLFRVRAGEATRFGSDDGLTKEQVLCVAGSAEGGVWVGTVGGGLNRLRRGVFASLGPREGLSHDHVTTLYRDGDDYWIATWGGGLNHFRDGAFEVLRAEDGLGRNYVTTVLRDSRGVLWVGTAGCGLRRRDPDGSFHGYTTGRGVLEKMVTALAEDGRGVLWVGTGEGLNRREGDHLVPVSLPGGGEHEGIRALFVDTNGTLWVGRDGGLTHIDGETMSGFTSADGLLDDDVFAIFEDRDRALWIGTASGVNRMVDGRIDGIDQRHGLPVGKVNAIVEDERGRLWMTSHKGVFHIDKTEIEAVFRGERSKVSSTLYGRGDGLPSRECSGGMQPAALVEDDGRFWFPTIAGLATVHPEQLPPPRDPPGVSLESVLVNRRVSDPREAVRLPREEGELEFHFGAVALLDANEVRFRYRLEGFDEAWRETRKERSVRYTNVPHGSYRFVVSAAYGTGRWSDDAEIDIALVPHFYQRADFLSVVGVGGLAFLGGLFVLRSHRVRAREATLARLVDERTSELRHATRRLEEVGRKQSDFVSGISHELKTPLTLIRLYSETLIEQLGSPPSQRVANSQIIVREVERLTRMVNRLLDFSRIEQGAKSYELGPGDLARTVRKTVGDYESYLRTEGKRIRLEIDDGIPATRFDSDAVSTAMVNLLDNAAKYSGGSETIEVAVCRRDGAVAVEVRDHGIGIGDDELERIFERFYRVPGNGSSGGYGIGLFIVKNVLDGHGGRIEVTSTKGAGSTFRLLFPL